jgi:ABC-type antimicrobial peptide transport system permease subunit
MLFMGFPWAAFLGVILILNLAGFLLCFLPILKASRTQIITVLRDE